MIHTSGPKAETAVDREAPEFPPAQSTDEDSYFKHNDEPSYLASLQVQVAEFIKIHKDRKIALVTSGGTTVPLENNTVRFIDNFSAGTRGSTSAEYFLEAGYAVIFLHRQFSLLPYSRHYSHSTNCFLDYMVEGNDNHSVQVDKKYEEQMLQVLKKYQYAKRNKLLLLVPFTTVNQYLFTLRMISQELGQQKAQNRSTTLFYLAAAVSDFFLPRSRVADHKIQSQGTGKLVVDLDPVPKFLKRLVDEWTPGAMIVSFKLETDSSLLIGKARGALERYSHQLGKKGDEVDQAEIERQVKAAVAAKEYFSELLERNASRHVQVRAIRAVGGGARSTRREFLNQQFEPIFQARNLSSLLSAVDTVYDNLAGLGIYENVTVALDETKEKVNGNGVRGLDNLDPFAGLFGNDSGRAYDNNERRNSGSKLELDAVVKLAQAKRFYAKTGTDLGNGEGNGYANMTFKNIFGGAEILSLDATMGTRTRSSYIANFSTPVLSVLPPQWRLETVAYMTSRTIPWASNEQLVRGMSTKIKSVPSLLKRPGQTPSPQQELGFEAVWRTIACSPGASSSVRDEAGNSLKASIFHSIAYDTRDSILLATHGNYYKFSHELAGLGGIGNAFYKTSFESQHNWLLFASPPTTSSSSSEPSTISSQQTTEPVSRTSLHIGTKAGLLWMLARPSSNSDTPPPSNLMDRFYLGGPNDVRGFYSSGIGPRDQSDSLGGEALLAAGVSLLTPIPKIKRTTPLRFHTFLNAGNLLALDRIGSSTTTAPTTSSILSSTAAELLNTPSISTGVGLLYCHPAARFELNITFPLIARRNEATRKGIQFGVGLSFL
ncbi:phosphopantothenate--cysteine ligase CAB2 [Sugiyamaella lignohabitans]|uniref:Phosphopantothenate--cysteine ligase CAB2 n=1 Tax=Sugiyamaella lignohabitans TaxID=796027 RepID=A0A161HEY5_9ASCO|nr:phosphopantothenate--cysteine ligase CAB2 [Sugiyamaella lignohabitans]ANB13970.1 phosphopantothenate--cysteine ligase CAB2 [Sugiyamaella lignohabitans]